MTLTLRIPKSRTKRQLDRMGLEQYFYIDHVGVFFLYKFADNGRSMGSSRFSTDERIPLSVLGPTNYHMSRTGLNLMTWVSI